MENTAKSVVILQAHKSALSPAAVKKLQAAIESNGMGFIPIIFGGEQVYAPRLDIHNVVK